MTGSANDIRESAHHWRARMDDGGLSADERAAFNRWMADDPSHGEAFAEAEIVWKVLGAVEYDPALDAPLATEKTEGRLARLFVRLRESFAGRSRVAVGGLATASVACIAVILAVLLLDRPVEDGLTMSPVPVVFETTRGQIDEITLSDGSRVTLGAMSQIDVVMTRAGREVQLVDGAAFFEVATDTSWPFTVTSGATEVRVTGTAFAMQQRGDTLHVAVQEGAVQVARPGPDTGFDDDAQPVSDDVNAVSLSAGQGVMVSEAIGWGDVVPVPAAQVGAWRTGQLIYVGATLDQIIHDVNRYAAQPITLAPVARGLKLSGTFDVSDIEGLLWTLEAALPVRIEDGPGGPVIVMAE